MSAIHNALSELNSALGSFFGMPVKSEQARAAAEAVPECPICLENVSDPIALKCKHVFDRHCIKECLTNGLDKCPTCRSDVKETDFNELHDIYEITKCQIKAQIFTIPIPYPITVDASIFSTIEKVQEKVLSQYLKKYEKTEPPIVRRLTFRAGSDKLDPNKTLAEYQIYPGEDAHLWFLTW